MSALMAKKAVARRPLPSGDVVEMFAGSLDPPAARDKLLAALDKRNAQAKDCAERGWAAAMAETTSNTTNMGVVAALVLSFSASLAISPLTPLPDADDMWSDHRERMADVCTALFFLGTMFAVSCVIVSVLQVNYATAFVNNIDDFLWWINFFPKALVDALLVICLLLVVVGSIVAMPVVNPDPLASVCFFSGIVVCVLLVAFYIRILSEAVTREKRMIAAAVPRLKALIEAAFDQFQEGQKTDG